MNKYMILIAVSLCFMHSCANKQKSNNPNKDEFYLELSGYDYSRIPLIKPYEAITLDDGVIWHINLPDDNTLMQGLISNVKKIDVIDGTMMFYAGDGTILKGTKVNEAWFIIDSDKKIEEGFDKEKDFLKFIKEHKLSNPNWKTPHDLYVQFKATYCLDWIPGCKTN